jgi:hypothetical protein
MVLVEMVVKVFLPYKHDDGVHGFKDVAGDA